MMLAVSILLSWTISSPDISEFFDIPDWCPTAVSSAATFGSADNYVECFSNDVRTAHWQVFRNEEDVTEIIDNQPTWIEAEGKWDITRSLDPRHRTQHIEWEGEEAEIDLSPDSNPSPEYVGSSKKDDRLSWMAERQFYDISIWDYVWISDVFYTAISDGLVTNRTSIGYRPKSSRLTPEWLAATYAPFAAWCERVYYFNEGQESDWDEDVYGPFDDMRKFRFSLPQDTHGHPEFGYEPDTNRAIRTRRLIEFDNLKNLMDSCKTMYLNSNFNIERPGWWSDPDGGSWKTILHGGTLLEQTFPNFKELPTVAWTSDPTTALASNVWHDTAITFDRFYGGGNLTWSGDSPNHVPRIAIDALNFGENWAYDETHMLEHGLEGTVSYNYDIETVFSNAYVKSGECVFDPTAFATRRLVMRDFALVDQILAALDVTYNALDPQYYGRVDDCFGDANGSFSFDQIEVDVAFDSEGKSYISSDLYLSGASLGNVTYTNGVSMTQRKSDFSILVEPSFNTYEYTSKCGDVYGIQIAAITGSQLTSAIGGAFPPYGDVAGTCSVHSVAQGIVNGFAVFALVAEDDQSGREGHAYAEALLADRVWIRTNLDVSRHYIYHVPRDINFGDSHGVLHPGSRGWDRSNVSLWSGLSCLIAAGTQYSPVYDVQIWYDYYREDTHYYAFDYNDMGSTGLSAVEGEMDSELLKLYTKMDTEIRRRIPSFDSAAVVVPIRREYYTSMINHTRYAAGARITAALEAIQPGLSGLPIVKATFRRHGESEEVKLILADGSVVEVPDHGFEIGVVSYDVEGPTEDSSSPGPELTEEYGASAYGKFNFWTKVKWNWNALRLNWD